MSRHQQRLNHVASRLSEENGEWVEYTWPDSGLPALRLCMEPQRVPAEEILNGVSITRTEYVLWYTNLRDFQTAAFNAGWGQQVFPATGHKILRLPDPECPHHPNGELYRVAAMGGDEVFQYVKTDRNRIYIHSILIREQDWSNP